MSNLWITPEELGDYAETEFAYEAAKSASNLLWALSGRKFSGVVTVTERYVCAGRVYRYGPSINNNQAVLVDGDVFNFYSDDLDFYEGMTADGITSSSRIRLRGRPVTKVHTIRDRSGNVISPDKYYLVDHSTIQATLGVPWTPCNIEITYSYGTEPPTLGKMAARTLAIEFVKLWNGHDDCALPQRVTSISRQGVSYTLLDSQDFIDEMRTGLYAVDLFLKSVNPDRARAKARVFTPDVPRARRNTPKSLKLATSDLDISVTAGGIGSTSVSLSSINALFLKDPEWSTEVVIRSYGETAEKTLDSAATVSDPTPSAINVVSAKLEDDVVTLTTGVDHGLFVGTSIVVSGIDATFNGTFAVLNVPTSTTFTYTKIAADVAETSVSGSVSSTTDDRLTVTIGYEDALSVLKMIDPGTWDLYAIREVGGVEEVVYVCSGNLKIALATSALSTFTIG
jgi:hypothetical protein